MHVKKRTLSPDWVPEHASVLSRCIQALETVFYLGCQRLAYTRRFRSLDGGIDKDSLYFAMVLLATLMPCSASIAVILLSLKGLR